MLWLALGLFACRDKAPADSDTGEVNPVCEAPGAQDDTLRLNAAQALGTHNSYHIEPETPLDASWAYTMEPLTTQLDGLGLRQLELDVHLHRELGWQVFHLPGVDDGSVCLQLSDCLAEIKAWSDAHPCHLPVTVWVEPKDDIDEATDDYGSLSGRWDELDAAIREVMPPSRLFTPDDLRGDDSTLLAALSARGWPTLGELRGRVLFALLDSGDYRDEYLADAPVAEGRVLFPRADDPAQDFAAVFKIDDPVGDHEAIQARVGEGFLVTCTADAVGATAEENAAGLEQALSAACHSISTNAPAPNAIDGYSATIPDGTPARCNPISAPASCTSQDLEDLD